MWCPHFWDIMCSSSCRIISLLVIVSWLFFRDQRFIYGDAPLVKAMEILLYRIISRLAIPSICAMFVRGKRTVHSTLLVIPAYRTWGHSLSFSSSHCGQLGFEKACEEKLFMMDDITDGAATGWKSGQNMQMVGVTQMVSPVEQFEAALV